MEHRDNSALSGEVHMDGAYVNGHIREKNNKEDRIDLRLAENQKPTKRYVLVMRQRKKTLTFVTKSENQANEVYLADRFVKKDAVICADESPAYDTLHTKFDTRRINHAKESGVQKVSLTTLLSLTSHVSAGCNTVKCVSSATCT